MNNKDLINNLISKGVLKSHNIKDALENIDRIDFVGDKNEPYAYYDEALPIGHGQTISQPFTVVFMLELLGPRKGDIIMDVGSGSGWQSCLLAHIVGEKGFIHAIEVIPKLSKIGQENSLKYPTICNQIKFYCQSAEPGIQDVLESNGGFDKIICAAEIKEVPQSWREQLKINGVMVYPKGGGVYKETKIADGEFESEYYPGFIFVPFI